MGPHLGFVSDKLLGLYFRYMFPLDTRSFPVLSSHTSVPAWCNSPIDTILELGT
jgi:hypothetical protein